MPGEGYPGLRTSSWQCRRRPVGPRWCNRCCIAANGERDRAFGDLTRLDRGGQVHGDERDQVDVGLAWLDGYVENLGAGGRWLNAECRGRRCRAVVGIAAVCRGDGEAEPLEAVMLVGLKSTEQLADAADGAPNTQVVALKLRSHPVSWASPSS